jgi:hypothetical protein
MTQLVALSLSIGLLGGVATFLFRAMGLMIWAGFIAWACFFHSGGDTKALKHTIAGNIFGSIMAYIALFIALNYGLGELGIAVVVAVTVFILCMGAHAELFSVIPAGVYGYAVTVAYFLLVVQKAVLADLMQVQVRSNPMLDVIISLVLGALFGFASGKLAGVFAKKA